MDFARYPRCFTVEKEEPKVEKPVVFRFLEPSRVVRSTVLRGTTYRKATPIGTRYSPSNARPDPSDIFEVFINVAKVGSDVVLMQRGLKAHQPDAAHAQPPDSRPRAQAIIGQLGHRQRRSMGFERIAS